MRKSIEIWSDSFHEGNWCCDRIADIANKAGCTVQKSYAHGFQPRYIMDIDHDILEITVYGSYKSWSPLPKKIKDLIEWGKPDFIAFDPAEDKILFAVEETAATPTGNQAMQRCERQYGSARLRIPYWYLISEFGVHRDGGIRRDSIWPTIAALKLSVIGKTPCIVLHYSDIDNPENYNIGSGVNLLFTSLFGILKNHIRGEAPLHNSEKLLESQYREMIEFLLSQWQKIIDFLPSENILSDPDTAKYLAEIATGNDINKNKLSNLLVWPLIKDIPKSIRDQWTAKSLLKHDPLCYLMEKDIEKGKAYYLSDNAGSGKPPSEAQLTHWISQQEQLFKRARGLKPAVTFDMKLSDFPDTGKGSGRRHLTTAKNIVYLYDSWNAYVDTVVVAYPRLAVHLKKKEEDMPVFVYVSNSIKPGRLFGDPFTGQLSAFSTAFGKFDKKPRMVVAYFPHQVHVQAIQNGKASENKGMTLMTELTDCIIFNGGVAVKLSTGEVL